MLSLDVRLGAMSQAQRDAARAWLQACWDSLFAHGSHLADKLCAAGMVDCNYDAGELLKALMAEGWIEQGKNPCPTVSQRAFDVNGDGARNPHVYPTRWGYSPVRKSAGLVRYLFDGRRDLPYLLGVYCGEPVCPRCWGVDPGEAGATAHQRPQTIADAMCAPCEALYQARKAETAKAEAEAPVEKPAKARKLAKVDPKTCTHAGPYRVIQAIVGEDECGAGVGCRACGCVLGTRGWYPMTAGATLMGSKDPKKAALCFKYYEIELVRLGPMCIRIVDEGVESLDDAKALAEKLEAERVARIKAAKAERIAREQAEAEAKAKAAAEARAKLDAEKKAEADERLARMQELRRRRELSEREQRKLAQADKAARKAAEAQAFADLLARLDAAVGQPITLVHRWGSTMTARLGWYAHRVVAPKAPKLQPVKEWLKGAKPRKPRPAKPSRVVLGAWLLVDMPSGERWHFSRETGDSAGPSCEWQIDEEWMRRVLGVDRVVRRPRVDARARRIPKPTPGVQLDLLGAA